MTNNLRINTWINVLTDWEKDLSKTINDPQILINSIKNRLNNIISKNEDSSNDLLDNPLNLEIYNSITDSLIKNLNAQNPNDNRILKYLKMPDLTRLDWSILKLITEKIVNMDIFKDFDLIKTPEIVPTYWSFDLFDFPEDHPARSRSDTYFANDQYILKTHTTVMWYYYFFNELIRKKLEKNWEVKSLSFWKVYRKDEVNSKHYPVFHQIDGLYMCEKSKKIITKEDLEKILIEIAKEIYWENIEYRINIDIYPYTNPSLEMEIKYWDDWLEILWWWIVAPWVLEHHLIDSSKYNWWAFWFWVDRLAMIKKSIPDIRLIWSEDQRITKQWWDLIIPYQEVSNKPSTYRDISFIIDKKINLNNYYEIVRDEWWDLIEEIKLLDQYENDKKFWPDKKSYTFRIVYRSFDRTLSNEEINSIQRSIREKTSQMLNVILR